MDFLDERATQMLEKENQRDRKCRVSCAKMDTATSDKRRRINEKDTCQIYSLLSSIWTGCTGKKLEIMEKYKNKDFF